jgi:hypothetical protein
MGEYRMKIAAWILCFCFTVNVFASTGLAEVVDDYNYSINVEWDQIDQKFYKAQTEVFVARVQSLLANGLSPKEVEEFVSARVNDRASLEEFASLSKNVKTTQDLVSLLQNNSGRMYHQGANWNGATVYNVVISTVAAVYVIFVVYRLTHLKEEG